jgi:hypothetical protein
MGQKSDPVSVHRSAIECAACPVVYRMLRFFGVLLEARRKAMNEVAPRSHQDIEAA